MIKRKTFFIIVTFTDDWIASSGFSIALIFKTGIFFLFDEQA
tara:strand:- start:1811 stop:1936 length:126 start_codon:yes stop_codon:yes gene_type:complete